ncbi:MAG TPA: metallophosphoesterase [Methanosarcinaceae archaeon]|nr:metallophosphoesterase [Methanosarcinaceae archaeon]
MKLIAVSDTHIHDAHIPHNIIDIIDDCDIIVHAGDFTSMECYKVFASTGKLKAVCGNSDEVKLKKLLPDRIKFEVEGIKIGVVHKGGLSITNTTAVRYLALEMGVDILIFGHIHSPLIEKSDVMIVCPGSPTSPRMADPTVVELIIKNGSVSGRIIELKGKCCDYVTFSRNLGKHGGDRE